MWGGRGSLVPPVHRYYNDDEYTKQSHELRITSPQDNRVRGLLGVFWQEQKHDFWQPFLVEGLADIMLPDQGANPLFADIVYLNSMDRKDTDEAMFGSVSFDITEQLELTGGIRFFKAETSVKGFFGFGLGFNPSHVRHAAPSELPGEPGELANGGDGAFSGLGQAWSRNGEWRCPSQETVGDKPCMNVDRKVESDDHVGRINLNYKVTDDVLLYATWSEGFRPGGINRNPFVGDYESDFLTNWELGWKTQWADGSVQFNGAVFFEQWDDLQRAFPGDERHHPGGQRAERGDQGHRDAAVVGGDRQLPGVGRGRVLRQPSSRATTSRSTRMAAVITAPEGTPAADHAGFQGQSDRALRLPGGRVRGASAGRADLRRQPALGAGSGRERVQGRRHPVEHRSRSECGHRPELLALELFVKNATDEDAPHVYRSGVRNNRVCPRGARLRRSRHTACAEQPMTMGLKFSQEF